MTVQKSTIPCWSSDDNEEPKKASNKKTKKLANVSTDGIDSDELSKNGMKNSSRANVSDRPVSLQARKVLDWAKCQKI